MWFVKISTPDNNSICRYYIFCLLVLDLTNKYPKTDKIVIGTTPSLAPVAGMLLFFVGGGAGAVEGDGLVAGAVG